MGIIISYLVGASFIIFPKLFAPTIASITYHLTRHASGAFRKSAQEIYDEASEDQMKVRPAFTIFLGVFIVLLTLFVQSAKEGVIL